LGRNEIAAGKLDDDLSGAKVDNILRDDNAATAFGLRYAVALGNGVEGNKVIVVTEHDEFAARGPNAVVARRPKRSMVQNDCLRGVEQAGIVATDPFRGGVVRPIEHKNELDAQTLELCKPHRLLERPHGARQKSVRAVHVNHERQVERRSTDNVHI
jgi:hypothetical protein